MGYAQSVHCPGPSRDGQYPYSGYKFRIRGYEGGHRSPAPVLGEHNEVVLRDILGLID